MKKRKWILAVLLGVTAFGAAFSLGLYCELAAFLLVKAAVTIFLLLLFLIATAAILLAVLLRRQLSESFHLFLQDFLAFDFPTFKKAAEKIKKIAQILGKELSETLPILLSMTAGTAAKTGTFLKQVIRSDFPTLEKAAKKINDLIGRFGNKLYDKSFRLRETAGFLWSQMSREPLIRPLAEFLKNYAEPYFRELQKTAKVSSSNIRSFLETDKRK